jgi:hypothetical protein
MILRLEANTIYRAFLPKLDTLPMITLIPHNAFNIRSLNLVAKQLESLGHEAQFWDIQDRHGENVRDEANALGIRMRTFTYKDFFASKPSALVTMNDWGTITKWVTLICNSIGTPTFSIVEGVQDFDDSQTRDNPFFKRRYPYSRSKFQLVSGKYDLSFFSEQTAKVVGLARLDSMRTASSSRPDNDRVLINCNFSYGVHADKALTWVSEITKTCLELNIPYVICQHIADDTDLSNFNVSDKSIYEEIDCSTVMVSRFSSCVLEAFAMKKPVVYFDNFKEGITKFSDPKGAFVIAKTEKQLREAIRQTISDYDGFVDRSQDFLNHHVDYNPNQSSPRRAAIEIVNNLRSERFSAYTPCLELVKETMRHLELYHLLRDIP